MGRHKFPCGVMELSQQTPNQVMRTSPTPLKKRKKKDTTKPSEKEDELESVFQRLKAKHEVNYSGPQLRLWARMIVAKTHDDFDKPPNVPMITEVQRTKQKESLSEALTSAAVAVAKVFSPASENKPIAQGYSSPSKKIDLRMKN